MKAVSDSDTRRCMQHAKARRYREKSILCKACKHIFWRFETRLLQDTAKCLGKDANYQPNSLSSVQLACIAQDASCTVASKESSQSGFHFLTKQVLENIRSCCCRRSTFIGSGVSEP